MLSLFKSRSKIKPPRAPGEKKQSGNSEFASESSQCSGEFVVQRSFASESKLPRPQSRQRKETNENNVSQLSRQCSGSDMSTDVVQKDSRQVDKDRTTPRRLLRGGIGDPTQDPDNVQVVVRIRPMSKMEEDQGIGSCCTIDPMDGSSITIRTLPEHHTYTFDRVAAQDETQEGLFEMLGRPIVENVLAGYNSCIFAYGQTGSGKTYTMLGEGNRDGSLNHSQERGLTPRLFELLFERMEEEQAKKGPDQLKYCLKCSFLEIYNEQIQDLLEPSQQHLQIREDLNLGVHVEGLSEHNVFNVSDAVALLQAGAENRRQGETNMNLKSSRSHAVFTCVLESKYLLDDGLQHIYSSRLNLVDLAGSERQDKSGAVGGRLKEASHINKSLTILGYVINCLVELQHGRRSHVPYRDSRLTFLLQDSLGGNSKTIMIANVSPAMSNVQETLSTVRFASRAKKIKNKAVVNEDTLGDVRLLQQEIERLNRELHRYKSEHYANQYQQQKHLQQQQQIQFNIPMTPPPPSQPFSPPPALPPPPQTQEVQVMTSPFFDIKYQELEQQKQLLQEAIVQQQLTDRQFQEIQRENQRLQQLYILNRRYYRRYLEFKDVTLRGWKDGLLGSQIHNHPDRMVTDESENTGDVQISNDKALEELFQVRQALLDLGDDPESDNDVFLRRTSQQGVMKVEDYELLQNRLQEELSDNQRAYHRIEKLISDNHQLQQSQLSLEREISELRHERMQLQQQHSMHRANKTLKIRHSSVLNESPFSPSNSSPVDVEALVERQNEMAAKLDGQRAEIKQKDESMLQLQTENRRLVDKVHELEADGDMWHNYVDDLKQEIHSKQRDISMAQIQLADHDATVKELQNMQEQLRSFEEEKLNLSALQAERQWFENMLQKSQTECEVLEAQKEEISAQLAVQNQVVDEKQQTIHNLRQQIDTQKDLQERLLGKEDECSVLQTELQRAHNELKQMEQLQQQQEDYKNMANLCDAYREELEINRHQNSVYQAQISELQTNLENQKQHNQSINAQLDQVIVEKRQLEHQLAKTNSQSNDTQQLQNQIQQLQQQLTQTQHQNKNISEMENQIQQLQQQTQSQNYDRQQMEEQIRQLQQQLIQMQGMNDDRQQMQNQLRQFQEQLSYERDGHRCQMEEITAKVALTKQEGQNRILDLQKQLKEQCEQCRRYQMKYEEVQEQMQEGYSQMQQQMQEEEQAHQQQLMSMGVELRETQKALQDLKEEFQQVQNLKGKYDRLVKERERFLVKIQDLQVGTDKALTRADNEERKVKVLKDETNTLRQQLETQSKQAIELQNELSILSGQQNASQRIHHLKKVKDENNVLKGQMQQMQEFNGKLQYKIDRLSEELKHKRQFRDADQMDFDEEFSLRDEKLRAETEKMKVFRDYQQLTQTLMDLLISQINEGVDENTPPPNIAEQSPHKINIDSMELDDVKKVAAQQVTSINQLFQKQQEKLWLKEEQIKLLQLQQNSQQ